MKQQQFNKIWKIPLLLGCSIMFGLLSALLGSGIWFVLSWVAMLVPIGIIVWSLIKKTPAKLASKI
jgi:hypothetical protein